jgi:phosphoribosylanthranilate isomerase
MGRSIMVRVKICGITSITDARVAEGAGADAVGLVLHSDSPRNIGIERAAEIISSLGPLIAVVAVTHTRSAEEIADILSLHPSALQVYTDIDMPGKQETKVIRVVGRGDVWREGVNAIAVDESMGRGKPYDPLYARSIVAGSRIPVILAGGLSPENVEEAITLVRPYAVDVCSGVEVRPGVKDKAKVIEFVAKCKKYR